MLLQTIVKKIEKNFPEIEFKVSEKDYLISIPAKHNDVGPIAIKGDID